LGTASLLVPERITGLGVALGAVLPARAGGAATPNAVTAATPHDTIAVRAFDHFIAHSSRH
jgi:hypothetical protein